jgi:hypothetical protein
MIRVLPFCSCGVCVCVCAADFTFFYSCHGNPFSTKNHAPSSPFHDKTNLFRSLCFLAEHLKIMVAAMLQYAFEKLSFCTTFAKVLQNTSR